VASADRGPLTVFGVGFGGGTSWDVLGRLGLSTAGAYSVMTAFWRAMTAFWRAGRGVLHCGDRGRLGSGWGVLLTVAKVTAAVAPAYADYLQGKAQETELGDYYLKDGERVEAPGRWLPGSGPAAVGADRTLPVTGGQLRELMAVRRPDTGGELRRVGASGEAVAALDATFSAPKSVSAIWALAEAELRERIEGAHETAIDRAIGHATSHVAMIRRRVDRNEVIHARAAGLVATSWRHTTARAVAGQVPDPQLHSHVLLHAAVRSDGEVVAIDSRSWLVHRRELGAAYRTELAHELHQLGFQIDRGTGRGGRYFEINGVPGGLIDEWSSRHHQVHEAIQARMEQKQALLLRQASAGGPDAEVARVRLEALRAGGRLAAVEERYISQATRSAKVLLTHQDLDRHWQTTAQTAGFDADGVERLRTGEQELEPVESRRLVAGLTEFDATFTDREARAVALETNAGLPITDALQSLREAREEGELLRLADGAATTRTHRAREREVLVLAGQLASERDEPVPAPVVLKEVARLDSALKEEGAGVSGEQHRAIELACSGARLVVIEGQAGTGKSTTLTAIARAHQAAGHQVIVTSTAALAAQRLAGDLDTASVHAASYSTAGLQAAIHTGRASLNGRTAVIHDEAALASTREQHQLLRSISESEAWLIEVGDPRQSQAVGAGGLWPHLEHTTRDHHAHVELTRNLRAQDPHDRRDQALFRNGNHEQALAGYHDRRRVHLAADQTTTEDEALEAAHTDRQAGRHTLVIAQSSNEHLDELNARAQALRIENGELGEDSVALTSRPYRLHAGDEIQLRRNIHHPDHGPLRNGTTATITTVNPHRATAELQLPDGSEVTLDQEQLARSQARLAYVQHPFPAQGQTSDTAYLIVGPHTTQEGSYVAITRARHTTQIHASQPRPEPGQEQDPLVPLARRMSRTEPDLPSISTPLAHEHHLTQRPNEHEPERLAAAAEGPVPLERSVREEIQRAYPHNAPGDDHDSEAPPHQEPEQAGHTIENYRQPYNINPLDPDPLGPLPAAGEFQRRLDYRRASAQLPETHRGRDGEPTIEDEQQAGLDPNRDDGWEP